MRLLFVTLTGQGHITPTLALVAELVRRGHQVDYATEHPVGTGTAWVELPPLQPHVPLTANPLAGWLRHYFHALRATYPVLLEHCTRERPDGIVYDSTNWPARLVAEKLGIPAVRTIPNFASSAAFPLYDQMTAGVDTTELETECARFAARHGVQLDFQGTLDVPEPLNLVFLPRDFQPAADSFDDRFRFIGPLLGDREHREEWTPRGKPVLFISLGTIFTDVAFYRRCIEAFEDTEWHVAMTIGGTRLSHVPANFDVRPRFPQVAVLKQASAFITHAGMNSTMEALTYGVPLVASPMTPEQKANADRVVELGLGERVNPGDDLRAAVERARTKDLSWMRAVIRDSGGAAKGADEIENYLGGAPGVQRAL
ncbi:macrolide family glycosyltransferase [Kibdelosporangium persicum]|uniref:Antibiotic resistance macrolide glycosyltransferase n=1 Tax=Kibdelosporangium persicum TaxID=2698649 RepID=A0ABX2FII6_9PSEU|nr:macrolide family glycosyltransferase [Kibdelosporangium persicum]NRN70576.1 Antibiotic resistance macrolide glycosyltransferase [Kibdelosporangium persicum]